MADSLWIVVVARAGRRAKSRLAAALSAADRRRLVLAMLADVLDVCIRGRIGTVLAVVDTPAALATALHAGARVLSDPGPGDDMNAAVAAGVAYAQQHGAGTVVVLPADIPRLLPTDLFALRDSTYHAPRAVVVAASHDGQGTNALLLRPPDIIAPRFGPPSLIGHVAAGIHAGALTRVCADLGLAYDVDTPDDLAALAGARMPRHTAEVLAALAKDEAFVRA